MSLSMFALIVLDQCCIPSDQTIFCSPRCDAVTAACSPDDVFPTISAQLSLLHYYHGPCIKMDVVTGCGKWNPNAEALKLLRKMLTDFINQVESFSHRLLHTLTSFCNPGSRPLLVISENACFSGTCVLASFYGPGDFVHFCTQSMVTS